MSGSLVLLNLAGAVALLLFATRMVRTGVERAYGDLLRQRLRGTLENPILAVGAGGILAICLQSATAVCLIVGAFVGAGIVGGSSGLLAALGADVGSAIVAKLLSFNFSFLTPLCLVAGTALFMSTEKRELLQVGRILIGVGLLILSLRLIGEASEPLRHSALLPVVVRYLADDKITAFLVATIMTWLFHSSVAAILLFAALAERNLIPLSLGIVLVLGANVGGGIIAAMLTRAAPPRSRIVPVGNLLLRSAGALTTLGAIILLAPPYERLGASPALAMLNWHVIFNLMLALVGLPLVGPVVHLAERMTSSGTKRPETTDVSLTVLNEAALDTPMQALGNATREVVAVSELIENMLQRIIELYESATDDKVRLLTTLDDRVDAKHQSIKLYLTNLAARSLTHDEALRCQELLGACVKLEQVGDIIVGNMLAHARKRNARALQFTQEGWEELLDFHGTVLANARLAFNVLVSRDVESARQLVEEKDRLRELEKSANTSHFKRLREGTAKSIETSSIHLDTVRDLKQINSLLASMSYPVLEELGILRGSRLKES